MIAIAHPTAFPGTAAVPALSAAPVAIPVASARTTGPTGAGPAVRPAVAIAIPLAPLTTAGAFAAAGTAVGASIAVTIPTAPALSLSLSLSLTLPRGAAARATIGTTVAIAIPTALALTAGASATARTAVRTTVAIAIPAALAALTALAAGAARSAAWPLPAELSTRPLPLRLSAGLGRPLRPASRLSLRLTLRRLTLALTRTATRSALRRRRRGVGHAGFLAAVLASGAATAVVLLGIGGRAGQERQRERGGDGLFHPRLHGSGVHRPGSVPFNHGCARQPEPWLNENAGGASLAA